MNLLLLQTEDFISATRAQVSGRRFTHLRKIVRVKEGDVLEAGLLNDQLGTAIVTALDKHALHIEFTPQHNPPQPVDIALVLALPRPLMLKRTLQTITAFGIKQVHLIHSEKVEKSFWNSSDLDAAVIHEQLLLGLEQAKDTVLPGVHLHRHWRPFMQEILPALCAGRQNLLAHPGDYPPCPANVTASCTLAIGPEGGFTEKEVGQFCASGFTPVQLGERILRVEAAVPALLGRLLPLADDLPI